MAAARRRAPGYDCEYIEGLWLEWAAGKDMTNPPGNFLAFVDEHVRRNPLTGPAAMSVKDPLEIPPFLRRPA